VIHQPSGILELATATKMMHVRGALIAVVLLSLFGTNTSAQEVAYRISWDNPNSHLFDIQMSFDNPSEGPVSVRIPAWRPGRYLIQNFAKNIIRFAATDSSGVSLAFEKTDKSTWLVDAQPGESVTVSYQAYSHAFDAGSSFLDESEAFINPITMLMYIPGREMEPTTLTVVKPDDWITATALDLNASTGSYYADNYHELVDAPFIISPTLDILSFEHGGTVFELAIQTEAVYDESTLIDGFRSLVEAQTDMMGVIPFARYVFLFHLVPYKLGHGVEHKNSTSIFRGPVDFSNPSFLSGLLSISSHEFMHAWLVERIRPEAIYHPDYSQEAYTTTMWIYEGITNYYGSLMLERAGLITPEQFISRLAGAINSFEGTYGRSITSVASSGWDMWTKTTGAPPHTFYSFYTAGNVLGLLLDLEVRGRTRNRQSLDDVMRTLYYNYAAKDIGVPEDGLQQVLEEITGGSFQPFFDQYVSGTEPIDYDRFLFHAGYALDRTTNPKLPTVQLGAQIDETAGQTRILNVRPESPAFDAGLNMDDIIVALDGKRVHLGRLNHMLMSYSPGDAASVTVFRKDRLRQFDVLFKGGGNAIIKLKRMDDTSTLQNQIRRGWLGLSAG